MFNGFVGSNFLAARRLLVRFADFPLLLAAISSPFFKQREVAFRLYSAMCNCRAKAEHLPVDEQDSVSKRLIGLAAQIPCAYPDRKPLNFSSLVEFFNASGGSCLSASSDLREDGRATRGSGRVLPPKDKQPPYRPF